MDTLAASDNFKSDELLRAKNIGRLPGSVQPTRQALVAAKRGFAEASFVVVWP